MTFFLFSVQPNSQSLHRGGGRCANVCAKCSDSNENISGVGEEDQHKHRCFESALVRAGSGDPAWNPQRWAGATGHKPQINRGDWCCRGSSHAHKLQFTFLTEAPSPPSFLPKPCRLSLNQFSHSVSLLISTASADHVCHSQYHCDTQPGASEGLAQQEQNKLLLSSQRFGIEISNGTGRRPAEKIIFYHTKQTRTSEKPSWALSCVGSCPAVRNFLC